MPVDGGIDLLRTQRVDSIVYALVSSKFTTLAELKNAYTCWEALDLYEIYTVNAYNKNSIHKSLRK